MNKEILGQFETFITKMGKWRGKWANDDSDDYLGDYGPMVIIEGIEMRQPIRICGSNGSQSGQ